MDALQAELALYKLKQLDEWNAKYRQIADIYRDNLSDIVTTPKDKSYEYAVYHNFIINVEDRERLMNYLVERGVETKVHYPVLLHQQPAAKDLGYQTGDFPIAEKLAKSIMSLPIYPELRDDEIGYVISSIRLFYNS